MPEVPKLTEVELKQRAVRRHLLVASSESSENNSKKKAIVALSRLARDLDEKDYFEVVGGKKKRISHTPNIIIPKKGII